MTKQELDAMKLRMAELFKSYAALRTTKLAESAKQKVPQTINDLIRAAQWFFQAYTRLEDTLLKIDADVANNYINVSLTTVQQLTNQLADFEQAIQELEKYESYLKQIANSNPDKAKIQSIIQVKNREKPRLPQYKTDIVPAAELNGRIGIWNKNHPLYWDTKIIPHIAALEVTKIDVSVMQSIETNLKDWIACYNKASASSNKIQKIFKTQAKVMIQDNLPAIQAKLKETQDAFTRSEEKRADLSNPPAMPEPDGTYLNNQQTPNTAPFHLPIDANGMNPSDIKQGQIDDCTVMSSMGALAKVNPQLLQKMSDGRDRITQLANGDFEVIVYARNPKTSKLEESKQIVSNQFYIDGNGKLLYADSSSELWTMLYEKALAQVRGGYDGLEFTDSGEMIALLTGKESTRLATAGKTTLNDIEIFIQNAVNQNQAILVTSKVNVANLLTQKQLPVSLANKHAYWLESYNVGAKTFNLIDPRNSTASSPFGGTIQDLVDYFDFITVN